MYTLSDFIRTVNSLNEFDKELLNYSVEEKKEVFKKMYLSANASFMSLVSVFVGVVGIGIIFNSLF